MTSELLERLPRAAQLSPRLQAELDQAIKAAREAMASYQAYRVEKQLGPSPSDPHALFLCFCLGEAPSDELRKIITSWLDALAGSIPTIN